MSNTINDLIQFADTLQRRKVEDRRYQDQKNMQLAQIASVKDKEHKIIGSQHLLNNAMMKFNKSGWEDGIYKSSDVNSDDVLQEYLTDMDEKYGLAGDAIQVGEALSNQKSKQLVKDASELNLRIRAWDEQNKNKYANMNPFDNYKLAQDRKAYLKSLNADELYAKLYGSFGEAKAMEGTGLTPADFGKDASWFQKHPVLTGLGGAGIAGAGLFAGKSALGATEQALKGIKKPKMTAKVLKGLKKMAPWFAPEIGRAIDEKTGMSIPAAQSAGTAWLVTKAGKNLLDGEFAQFLKKRVPDVMAKVGKKAAAKHVASASTGVGANPYWQAGLIVTDLLAAGYAIQELYKEWENLSSN